MRQFEINVSTVDSTRDFIVDHVAVASSGERNAVMFVDSKHLDLATQLTGARDCLIFAPENAEVSAQLERESLVIYAKNARLAFAKFFADRGIHTWPVDQELEERGFAVVSKKAKIGANTVIMPGAKIIGDVEIGEDCYIGCNTVIVGRVKIGNRVAIAEDCAIGVQSFSYETDEDGSNVRMPQFGGVVIEDDVSLLVGSVVSCGAINDTVVECDAKIGMWSLVAHNDRIGAHSQVLHTQIAGSSTLGKYADCRYAIVNSHVSIGESAKVGFGSVVLRDVEPGAEVAGNPARKFKPFLPEKDDSNHNKEGV